MKMQPMNFKSIIRTFLKGRCPVIWDGYLHLRASKAYFSEAVFRLLPFLPRVDRYVYAMARSYFLSVLSGRAERLLHQFIQNPTIETDSFRLLCLYDQGRMDDLWELYQVMKVRYGEALVLKHNAFIVYLCITFRGNSKERFLFQKKMAKDIDVCGEMICIYKYIIDDGK